MDTWRRMIGRLGFLLAAIGIALAVGLVAPRATAASDRIPLAAVTPSVQSTVPRTFGASAVSYTVPSWLLVGDDLSFPDRYDTLGVARFCIVPLCILETGVLLPAGALVTSIEVDGCDENAEANFSVSFSRAAANGGALDNLATALSSGNPGCVFTTADLATPETIDNRNNLYQVRFFSSVADASLRVQAVRIFYTLQVSPAPAVASFNDVPPTHPFFQFIEALKAAGITGGCQASPPLFCPDAPLTRGQMAAFLAIALGLHFGP
jgi:hypothetical protein